MQHSFKEYDKKKHDKYHALTIKNPFAYWISIEKKNWEIRKKRTKFRGKIMICSSKSNDHPDMINGAMLCFAEIYCCKRVSELTIDEWKESMLPMDEKHKYRDHFAWGLRNIKRVIELPASGQLGIWNLVFDKGEIMEYPENLTHFAKLESMKPIKRDWKKYLNIGSFIFIILMIILIWIKWS